MTKYILTIFFLAGIRLTIISQDLTKELQTKTWYWTGKINDTLPITLTTSKPNQFDFIATFQTSHRLILSSLTSQKSDSIFSYGINKTYLFLGYETKDSSHNLTFKTTISADKKMILLKRTMSIKATYPGRDTVIYDYFWLTKGRKIRDIFAHDKVDIRFLANGNKQRTKGEFIYVRGDTICVDTANIAGDHFSMTGRDTIPRTLKKVLIPNITTFYHERKKLNPILACGIAVSAISFVLVSPLVSIEKKGFNTERFLIVGGSSLATMHFLIGARIVLGKKKMKVVRKNKKLQSWQTW